MPSSSAVRPFHIDIAEDALIDLRRRLRATRWPDALPGVGWAYGMAPEVLKPLVAWWADGFDWRAQEAELNGLPQFKAEVEGLDLHFIHARSNAPDPTPLLMLHGWPSSFLQMRKVIPLLTAQGFDVVAASLPGFGFSGRPTTPGMGMSRMADLMAGLMTDVLGYGRFVGRGSDIGGGVLRNLALKRPELLIGLHLSGTSPFMPPVLPADLSPQEQAYLADARAWAATETAYAQMHGTKPQTAAVGLNDSPAGLAAWILEKFHRWSDRPETFVDRYGRDALLANLTLYWATETIGSSIRTYAESFRDKAAPVGRVTVPTHMLMAGGDMFPTPRAWAARTYDIVRWTELDRGGHFLEWEEPQAVADDLALGFRSNT